VPLDALYMVKWMGGRSGRRGGCGRWAWLVRRFHEGIRQYCRPTWDSERDDPQMYRPDRVLLGAKAVRKRPAGIRQVLRTGDMLGHDNW
jgi:hypothetical protein